MDLDPLDSDLGTRSIKDLTHSNKVWICQEKFNEELKLRENLTSDFIHKMFTVVFTKLSKYIGIKEKLAKFEFVALIQTKIKI